MSSHEMASQTTAVQNEIPTTVRLSEYLRPEYRADAIAKRRRKNCAPRVCVGSD